MAMDTIYLGVGTAGFKKNEEPAVGIAGVGFFKKLKKPALGMPASKFINS